MHGGDGDVALWAEDVQAGVNALRAIERRCRRAAREYAERAESPRLRGDVRVALSFDPSGERVLRAEFRYERDARFAAAVVSADAAIGRSHRDP